MEVLIFISGIVCCISLMIKIHIHGKLDYPDMSRVGRFFYLAKQHGKIKYLLPVRKTDGQQLLVKRGNICLIFFYAAFVLIALSSYLNQKSI